MKVHFIAIGGSAMHNLAISLKIKGYEVKSSLIGKFKTVILDTSIGLCYLDFIVPISRIVMSIATILTNVLQVLTIVGYTLFYKEQGLERKQLKNA